ncbi:MAG: thioredoxin domain-containing protein [Sphingomonadaceae bacterium]|nr:thioredoxin domain-containing protein [Sphingomonadaceae bacterium]
MSLSWKQVAAGLAAMAVGASAVVFAETSGGAPADRGVIEHVVRDYILAHPEIIPEAMDRLQAKQSAAAIGENRKAIEAPFAGAWAGNPQGDVTLVEYVDYNCGFCRASVTDVDRLIADDHGLKVVFREIPILSPESDVAAKLSLVAAKQGKFYGVHKALYAAGALSDAKIAAVAAKAGVANAAALAKSPDIAAEIAANLDMAHALKLGGTPTFIVGDEMLAGAVGYDALKKAVADARAKRG